MAHYAPPLSKETRPGACCTSPDAVESCPVCGKQGACAYDAEGRPLIHTDTPNYQRTKQRD